MRTKRPFVPIQVQAFRNRPRRQRRLRWLLAVAVLVGLIILALLLPRKPASDTPVTSPSVTSTVQETREGPPWRYGAADARFTLTLYADIECPFCKAYYPTLLAWIDQHPETRLQWHHLPLDLHEPAAIRLAAVAECAGLTQGKKAFFDAVDWLYKNTRGNGQGLPTDLRYPGITPAMQTCLDDEQVQVSIRTQASEALHGGITATPSIRLEDTQTGKSLLLHGPVEGDTLLSALDLVADAAGSEAAIP